MAVQKYDIRRPDGSFEERYWSPLNLPVLNPEGEIIHIIHRVEDVTDFVKVQHENTSNQKLSKGLQRMLDEMESEILKRSKEIQQINLELEKNEEKFQVAFHASPAGMMISKLSDMRYLDVNDAFVSIIGYSREELIGHTSAELGITADVERREEVLKEYQENGSIKNMEVSMRNKAGSVIQLLCSLETVIINGEKHMLSSLFDITERKKAEEQLALVNKELEAFTYSISHDLRAPLRAVNGYAEMLLEDYGKSLDEEANRILNNIKHYAEKMGILIDDLLSFSRLGRKELQHVEIDMNDLMEGVISDLDKAVEYKAEIKIGKLHPIQADYGLIHQVMYNLISNAVKYSSKREKALVEVSSKQEGDEIIFTVKDNGAGFSMLYADKLFGVFQRLHSQEEFTGTGVGLAIVQRIVLRHGGRVWAEGEVDKGASFHFSIKKN